MPLKVVDSATFACSGCGEPIGISGVVLTEAFTYIFVAHCDKCDSENQYHLNAILSALVPKMVSEGSRLVN